MALSDYWNKFTSGLTDFFTDDKTGGVDWLNAGIAGAGAAGLGALYNSGALDGMFNSQSQQVGYQGKIPRYEMIRDRVERPDQERRAGGQGQRYFSRPRFATSENAPTARAESQAEAQQLAGMARGGLASIQRFANGGMPQGNMGMPKPPMQANNLMGMKPPMPPQGIAGAMPNAMNPMKPKPMGGAPKPPMGNNLPKPPQMGGAPAPMPAKPPMPQQAAPAGPMEPMDVLNSLAATGKVQPMPKPQMPVIGMAGGGIADINRPQAMGMSQMRSPVVAAPNPFAARNAQVDNPRYLGGSTDGMADRIPANIDGQQQAALSDGEFVIPADVVSHLGNGNSNAGAQQLYGMMDRIRQARTGNTQQGRQINPTNYMPKV